MADPTPDLTDEQYREIAREARRFRWANSMYGFEIIDHETGKTAWKGSGSLEVEAQQDLLNGRAAVAEYRRIIKERG